jgi:DNA-binding MarR family transcriptional regulator
VPRSPAAEPIAVDAYVVDTLLPDLIGHDRKPSAFVVYLVLWRQTEAGRTAAALSLRELAEATGLSKRAVQTAVNALLRRRLVALARDTPTSVPSYVVLRPWATRRGS